MKVLLLGSNGMLGQAISKELTANGFICISADRVNGDYCFDFTQDDELIKCVYGVKPDIIINTAAIVDLGFCETNNGDAYKVNSRLPGILANICKELHIYLIQISTDHYYTSGGKSKHDENERVSLVNEYARTKYLGEQLALTHDDSLVLRTNIVGFRGTGKATFVEWAIQELEKDSALVLFNDFFTSSIHTVDFARILIDIINKHPVGVLNLASSEVSSKKEFIIALSMALRNNEPNYGESSVQSIIGPRRAASLGLDTSRIESLVGYRMPGLNDTINSIVHEYYERKQRI